ncbi:hypothetical protein [Endozoicomonas arenosclerae]|uniref:hypothetical protein n=1 Tax=Endozoicomonas arenosclerae TaxID=1633495 RepID=UPI000780B21D|nr:hypothetical protein [Endozoicomonas arenosclerae]
MDRTGQGQPSPLTGPNSPHSETSEKESEAAAQHDHREITHANRDNLVARATAVAGTDEQLSKRTVSRKKYTRDEMAKMGKEVDESREAIKEFMKQNGIDKDLPRLECTRDQGYSRATRILCIQMEQMKQFLDAHFAKVNKMYQVLQSDYSVYKKLETTARRAARSLQINEEEQAFLKDVVSLGDSDKRHRDYWKERKLIHLYASFCGLRFNAALRVIPFLDAIQLSETFNHRIQTFLPQTIECMKMYQEVIQYQLGLEHYSDLEESLQMHDKAAFGVAMLADLAVAHYMLTRQQEELREMLSAHSCYFSQWLADFDPEQPQVLELESWKVKQLINAAILSDNPKQAQRLLQFYRKQVEAGSPQFAPGDTFSLCQSLLASLTFLYDRPEPLAHFKARVEGAEALVSELGALVRTINKKKMLPEDSRASLMFFYEQISNQCREVVKRLRNQEAGVAQIASSLIKEEEAEQKRIQDKLDKREAQRRDREEQIQKDRWKKKQAKLAAEAASEKKQDTDSPPPKPYSLKATMDEASEAFVRKQPVGVLNGIFKKVIQHPQVSGFDKAQAHYGYADMVTSRLRRQLASAHKMIEPVYAYKEALESQDRPDLDKDIKFREALKLFKLDMQQISINTLVMSKAVKEAQEIFFGLSEEQPEFLDALVDLHNDMEYLIAQGKQVIECCKAIPDIYARRGEMIHRHKLSGRGDSQRRSELVTRVKDLEELGKKLDTSMTMLEGSLKREQVAQVQQTLSTANAKTPEPEERRTFPPIEDRKQTLSPEHPDLMSEALPSQLGSSRSNLHSSPAPATGASATGGIDVPYSPGAIVASLPDAMRQELKNKLGKLPEADSIDSSPSRYEIHPANGAKDHPLQILAYTLGITFVVQAGGDEWIISPWSTPQPASEVATPKYALKLDFCFPSLLEMNNRSSDSSHGSLPDLVTSSRETSPAHTATPPDVSTEVVMENPVAVIIEEPEESEEAELPLKLFIPQSMNTALGVSIMERDLTKLMGLVEVETVQQKEQPSTQSTVKEETQQEWKTAGRKPKKGKKGKQQGRKEKGSVAPEPQAPPVKEEKVPVVEALKELDPEVLGLKLQTRLRDYLETLYDTGKTPDGNSVPEQLGLKALMTRIQQGTFLSDPDYLRHDFTVLSDALKIPIRANLSMGHNIYFRPGLVKPQGLDLWTDPDEPHLNLEHPSYAKDHQWFASLGHYFQCCDAEDTELFPEKPQPEKTKKRKDTKAK